MEQSARREQALRALGLRCSPEELLSELEVSAVEASCQGFDALEKYIHDCLEDLPESHEAASEVVEECFMDMAAELRDQMGWFKTFALTSCLQVPEGIPLAEDSVPSGSKLMSGDVKERMEQVLKRRLEVAEKQASVKRLEKELETKQEVVRKAKTLFAETQDLSKSLNTSFDDGQMIHNKLLQQLKEAESLRSHKSGTFFEEVTSLPSLP